MTEGTIPYSTGGLINPPEKDKVEGRETPPELFCIFPRLAPMVGYWKWFVMFWLVLGVAVRKENPEGGELRERPPMAGRGPSEGDEMEARVEGWTHSGLLIALLRLGELVMGFCFRNL